MNSLDLREWAKDELADALKEFVQNRTSLVQIADPLDADSAEALKKQLGRVLRFLDRD